MKKPLIWALLATQLTTAAVSRADDGAKPKDPWEGFNRGVFAFNEGFDRYLMKPVTKGYRFIAPKPVEIGVSNFFDNLWEVNNILNDVLQWKWGQAANDTGRLLLNSTLGIAGLFDVASHLGLPESEGEDFGQTLAVWGVGQGPYLVLPVFGPSTVRDGSARIIVDATVYPLSSIDHVPTRNQLWALNLIDLRSELLDAEGFISGDRYVFIRDAYLNRRDYLIKDGAVEDDFGGYEDF